MKKHTSLENQLLDAAIYLAGVHGWASLTMADIAHQARVPLADARMTYNDKTTLLVAFTKRVDREVLSAIETDDDAPVRDRIFEVLMKRFDALQAHRPSILAILGDLPRDPLLAAALLPHVIISMRWMLEAAGVSTNGPAGPLRVQGLAIIYLSALRSWIEDKSADLSTTMVALDKSLEKADAIMQRLPSANSSRQTSTFGGPTGK